MPTPMIHGHRQISSWTARKWDPLAPGRLGTSLVLSLVLHAGLTGVVWLEVRGARSTADVAMVELAAPEPVAAPAPADESRVARAATDSGEARPAEGAPEERTPLDPDALAGPRIAALEAAREELRGQVDSLSAENTELSARLDVERALAAALGRRLEEAREAERARLARVRQDYDDIVAALQSEIADKVIALDRANERLTLTIVDRVLFPSGRATLTPEGRRVMARVGQVLTRASARGILIEGHTDDVPIGPDLRDRYPSNWELSAARATEVVRFLVQETGVPAERLRAVGRADTDPSASNASEEGRRQNRRIEIILLPPGDTTDRHPTS
jgi:chemotaxis protein MotB